MNVTIPSLPRANCKSGVMIPRQHCHPPPPNPWDEFIDSKIHDAFIPSRISLPRVNQTGRCIFFKNNTPRPGPRHVVIRQMLQWKPPPPRPISVVDHMCDKSCFSN